LSHNFLKAARLYRHSLKTLSSWAIDREIFNDEADILRARFDANRGLPPVQAIAVMERGEDELFKYTHPDPYVRPYMPGGTSFMRFSPLPKEQCFPDGDAPADFPNYTVNPDMTICKPETGKSAVGSVLIDWPTKSMQ
jgi:NADH dehydrogenase (ubiquinone) 1 beta subcomplex subunit 9